METLNSKQFSFKTPERRHIPRTPSITPKRGSSRTSTPDRFIPSRTPNSISVAQHLLSPSVRDRSSPSVPSTTDKQRSDAYGENLTALFGVDLSNKILNFGLRDFKTADEAFLEEALSANSSCKNTPKSSSVKRKRLRTVPTTADRILDAPETVDDFYINTLDWGSANLLAVALGSVVYVWNADTSSIKELCRTGFTSQYITAVKWDQSGRLLAVATSDGEIQIWNVEQSKKVRSCQSHSTRVACLDWNKTLLASGSRSGEVHIYNTRTRNMLVETVKGHKHEVCGLKWSPNGRYLASGGNDCLVQVWDTCGRSPWTTPKHTFKEHKAAVKALSWCPWHLNLLATGGGSSDKTVKFWNVTSGQCMDTLTTDSQVSGVLWSEGHREVLVAQGFPQNQLVLLQYPSLQCVAELKGHEGRILHTSLSPDGTTVASVGADETLRLWKCFAGQPDGAVTHFSSNKKRLGNHLVSPFSMLR